MNDEYKPDVLKVFFGLPYSASEHIEIRQPKVRDIVEFGEEKFWGFVTRFAANTTSLRLPLWKMGIDWNKISDFVLFRSLVNGFHPEETKILFDEKIDFTKFVPVEIPVETQEEDLENPETKTAIVLVNEERPEIQIDEEVYTRMVQFVRLATGYHPKVERVKGKIGKQSVIDEEEFNAKIAERKRQKDPLSGSFLLPLFSFCLNHPGFKYKKAEILDMNLFEFLDSVHRILNTESVQALMSGMYSGFMDTSKIDFNKDANFTKDLYEKD